VIASLLFLLAAAEPLTTVASVDLAHYAGTWYEAARTPSWFQKKCVGDVRATYTQEGPEKVRVVNECREANGKTSTAKGSAKVGGSTAKLKVTFFWPFYGDYWVLELDPEYRWVVVGEPGRKYLWILTREPNPPDELVQRLTELAAKKGYDVSKLVRTPK
jgi:apolipoprotein D and lipocalin family protein